MVFAGREIPDCGSRASDKGRQRRKVAQCRWIPPGPLTCSMARTSFTLIMLGVAGCMARQLLTFALCGHGRPRGSLARGVSTSQGANEGATG
jgi:hypothetical protein